MVKRYDLVLAIYLSKRDFAFVLFEGSLSPIDWGITGRPGTKKRPRLLNRVARLLHGFQPDVLVLEDTSWTGTRRSKRIVNLNASIFELAEQADIPVCAFSRERVRVAFNYLGSPTKQAIAEAIAKHIPAFEKYLPPPRKSWTTEHPRMGLFDATALALTFFQDEAGGPSNQPR